jgi:hypothetical protein
MTFAQVRPWVLGGGVVSLLHYGLHDLIVPHMGVNQYQRYLLSYGTTASVVGLAVSGPSLMIRWFFGGMIVGVAKYLIENPKVPQNGFYIQQPGLTPEELVNQRYDSFQTEMMTN